MTDPGKASHRLSEDRPALSSTVSQMNRTLFSLIGCHGQMSSDSSSHQAVDQETLPQGTQPPAAEGEQRENVEVLSSTIRPFDDFSIQGAASLLTPTSEGSDAHVSSASRVQEGAEHTDRVSDQNSTPMKRESPPVASKKQPNSDDVAGDVLKEKGNGEVQKDGEKVVEEVEKEEKKKMESSESHGTRLKEVKIEAEEPLSEKAVEVLTSLGELIAKANHLPSNDNVRQIIAFLFMGLLSSEEFVGCLRSRKDVENLSATAIEENIVEIKKFLQKYTKELNLNEMKELLEAEEAFQKVTELFQRSSKDLGLGWIFVTSKEEAANDPGSLPPSHHPSPQPSAPESARSTSIASLDGNESASEDGALADDVVEDKEQLVENSDPVLHGNEQVLPVENIVRVEVTTIEEKSPSEAPDDVAPSDEPVLVVSQEEEENGEELPHSDASEQQLTQLDPLVMKMFNAMMEERKKEPPLISSRKDSGGKLNITWVKTGTDPAQNESSVPPSSKGVYIVESNDNVADGREEWNRMFSDEEGSERGVDRVSEEAVEQGEGEVEKKEAEEGEERDDEAVQEETSGGEKVGGAVEGIQEEVGEEKENGGGEEEETVRDAGEISKKKRGENEQASHQVQKSERLEVKTKKTYAYDETNDPLGLFARSEVEVIHPVYTLSESPYHAPFDEETATIPPDVRVKQEPSGEGDDHNVKMQHKEVMQKRKRYATEDRNIQKAMSNGIRCPAASSRFPRKAKERKSNIFVNEDNDIFGIFVRAPELVLPVYYLNETPPRSPCRDGADGRDGDSVDVQPADDSQDNVIPVKEENPSEGGVLDSVVSPFENTVDSGEVAHTDTQKSNSEDSRKSISPAEEGEKEAGDDYSENVLPADCQEDDSAIVDEKEMPEGDSEDEQPVDTPYAAIPAVDEDSKDEVQRVIAILTDPRPLDDAAFDKLLESWSSPRQKSPSIITLSDDENDVKIVMSYVRFAAKSVKNEEEDDQRGEGADSADGEGAEGAVVVADEAEKKKTKKKVRFSLPPKPLPKKPKPPIKLYDSRGNRFLSTEIQKRRQRKGSTWFVDTESVLAALSSDEEEEERERKKKKKKKVAEGKKKKETKEEGEGRGRGILRKAAVNDTVSTQTKKDKEAEEMKGKKQKKEPEKENELSKGKKKEGADVKEDPVRDKLLPSSSAEKEKESEEKKENTEIQGKQVNKETEKEKDKPPMIRGRGRPPKRRAVTSDEDEEKRPKRGTMEVSADEKREPKRGRGRPRLPLAPPKPSTSSSSTKDSGNMRKKNVSPAPSSATVSQPSSSTSTKSPKPLSVDRPMAVDDMLMSDVLRIQKPVTLAPRRLSSGQFESRVALYVEPSLGSIKIPPIGMPYQLRPTDSIWPSIRCCAVLYVLKDEHHLKDKSLPDDIPRIFIFIENASAPRLDVPKNQKLPKDLEKLLMKMISKL